MADAEPALDVRAVQRAIHGHRVVSARLCDYCGEPFTIDDPVLYEVVRIRDLPNFEALVDPPEGWFPDAARCQACHRDRLAPATDGIDEALVTLEITESAGLLRIDATDLEVVDYAPSSEGYDPPVMDVALVASYRDLLFARWIRLQRSLEIIEDADEFAPRFQQLLALSRDVPPQLQ